MTKKYDEIDEAQACYEVLRQVLTRYGCRVTLAAIIFLFRDISADAGKSPSEIVDDIKKLINQGVINKC